jgi:hypothetical protein
LGLLAFLMCMTQVRHAIASITKVPLVSWGWTLGTLIIPIWCLYRPWIGFAEIRRAAIGMSKRQRISDAWERDGFSYATFAVALAWFILGCAATQVISRAIQDVEQQEAIGLPQIDGVAQLAQAQLCVDVAFYSTLAWYMFSLCNALRIICLSCLSQQPEYIPAVQRN